MPLDGYAPRSESEIITRDLNGWEQARTRRYNFDVQWQEGALLAWPEYANTFYWGNRQWPGAKKTQHQIDSSVSVAAHRFAAIINSSAFPSNAPWVRYYHPDDALMRQPGVAAYYDELTRTMWRERYKATANFRRNNLQNCQSLGVLGNANLYIDALDPTLSGGEYGLRYTALPVGEIWYIIDHQGSVCGHYRAFRYTAAQVMEKWPDTFPDALRPALERQSQEKFDVLQCVYPRDDYDGRLVGPRGMRHVSRYISVLGRVILEEKGYPTFPMATMRYSIAPDEEYGRGPMQMVLRAAKTLNAVMADYLAQAHLAVKPIYLTTNNATFELERYPGALNKGGLGDSGEELVKELKSGTIQASDELMNKLSGVVNDAFLVSFFQLALKLEETPNLSARQMLELTEQRATLMGPIADGPIDEYMGTLIPRELDVLANIDLGLPPNRRILPERPPVLLEALRVGYTDQHYETESTSPMTRAMMAGENASYMQMVETLANIARSSNDASVWDYLNNGEAIPGMARNRGIRPGWIATPQMVAAAQKKRDQAEAEKNRIAALPAEAANKKADAIVAKAQTGGNIGGTLSGVPATQMPGIPGNPPGTIGQPGLFGGPGLPGMPAQGV